MADEFNPQGVDQTPRNNENPNSTADTGNAEPKNPFVGGDSVDAGNASDSSEQQAPVSSAALAADQVAAEIFHRQSTLVCHRGQLQNVDRLSIRLVRERVEQRVQVVDRCHRIVVLRQRHDRDAHDFDRVVQAQRVAVFEVDRPDDVALALFELLGVEARDNHRC